MKFNSSLAAVMQEDSPAAATKENVIDGIFLTKFDTIDDKVFFFFFFFFSVLLLSFFFPPSHSPLPNKIKKKK